MVYSVHLTRPPRHKDTTVLSLIVYAIPYALGIVAVVALLNVYTNFRQWRTAPYFRLRKQGVNQGLRWAAILIAAGVGIALALSARGSIPPPNLSFGRSDEATPTAIASTTGDSPQSNTAAPPTPTVTLGPPTITPSPPPPTASPTAPIATIESVVTPPADATINITAISSDISTGLVPINPGTQFVVGIPRVYFFLQFENMADGMSWSRVLTRNGEVIRSESESWERGESGTAYYWFAAQGGWPTGQYEIQFFVGDTLLTTAAFEVIN